MAMDMFIKIGDLKGESADKTHSGSIDVLAWSWGVLNKGSMHTAKGGGSGKFEVNDLSFTKYIDTSSPELLLSACLGKHFPSAKLTVRKAGEQPLEYLIITMEELIISSVSTGGSGGEDRLTENVTLNFARVKIDYTAQTAAGGPGEKPKMGFDFRLNAKL